MRGVLIRWRRAAAVALCIFLAPLIVVTTPTTAAAVVNENSAMSVTLESDAGLIGQIPGVHNCWLSARYTALADGIEMGPGHCQSPVYSGMAQSGNGWAVEFTGTTTEDDPCSAGTAGTMTESELDGWSRNVAEFAGGTGSFIGGTGDNCRITEVCFTQGNTTGPGESEMTMCEDFNLEDPAVVADLGECDSGMIITSAGATHRRDGWYSGGYKEYRNLIVQAYGSTGAEPHGRLTYVAVVREPGGALTPHLYRQYWGETVIWPSNIGVLAELWGPAFPVTEPPFEDVVGVQIIDTDQTAAGNYFAGNALLLPQDDPTGVLGINDPGGCSWYFGEKIASIPTDERDEPSELNDFGITEEPPASEGGNPPTDPVQPDDDVVDKTDACTFDWADPGTYASGGICAVVAVLFRALDVLKSIAKKITGIAAAILDGVTGLFVPSQGYMGAQVDELDGLWDDTSVAKWKDGVTEQTFGGTVSGCGGLPVAWSMGGQEFSFTLLAACTGTMVNVASICKLVLTAALVIFGGLTCLRALGSGFGWNPGVGRGESA